MKEKQIEEIRKDIFAAFGGYAKWEEDWQSLAEAVCDAGYRKQSDVAREIFEEIEQATKNHGITYAKRKIAELKKKYT